MNRKNIAIIIRVMLIFALSIMLGIVFLIAAYTIPVNQELRSQYSEYKEYLGWNPIASNRYKRYESDFDTFEPDVLDDQTDSLILSKSYDDSEGNILYRAIYMNGYGRYWHGYVSVLRPLLYFVSYWDLLLLNSLLQVALVVALCYLVYKATNKRRYVLAALSSYLLLMPLALMNSLQFSPIFYISFAGSIIVISFKDKILSKNNIIYFFLILGIITCYLDFLTYPLLAWALPFCWLAVIADKDFFNRLIAFIKSAIAWVIGYVGMFLSKWALLFVICGNDKFEEAYTGEAFAELQGIADIFKVAKETYTRFDVLYTNWRHYLFLGYVLIILIWIIWAMIKILKNEFNISKNSVIFAIMTLSAPAWYLVFATHTSLHHFFTYRNYVASILALILLICESVSVNANGRARIRDIILLVITMSIGLSATYFSRENIRVIYGLDGNRIALNVGEIYSCDFIPTFDDIREFGICIGLEDATEGNVEVRITGDNVNYSMQVDLADFDEAVTYNIYYVEWKFNPSEKYNLEVELIESDAPISLFATEEGNLPIGEYRNSEVNGDSIGNVEMEGSLVYNAPIQSRVVRLYLAVLFGFWLYAIAMSCGTLFKALNVKKFVDKKEIYE